MEMEKKEEEKPRASFLDLAAELRNNIYEAALTHDRTKGRRATPALLRTCKQVYREARGVFYAQSILEVKLSLSLAYVGNIDVNTRCSVRTCKIGGDLSGSIVGDAAMQQLNMTWPSCLARVHNLAIGISFQLSERFSRISSSNYAIINRVLYSLVAFLMENNVQMRTITFDIKDTVRNRVMLNSDPATLEKVFYPIAKIPKRIDLKLGTYFNGIEQALTDLRNDDIQGRTLRWNAIRHLRATVPKFENELYCATKNHRRSRYDVKLPAHENIIRQSEALEETKRIMEENYLSLETERVLEATTEVMRKAVLKLELERVEYEALNDMKREHTLKKQETMKRKKQAKRVARARKKTEQRFSMEDKQDEEDDEMAELLEMYEREGDRLTYGNWGKQREKMRKAWAKHQEEETLDEDIMDSAF